MRIDNYHHLQAPIEAPEPPDPGLRNDLIDALVKIIADEWMQNRIKVAEHRGFFTVADEVAIDSAVMAGDDMEVGRLVRTATRTAMLPAIRKEAERRADAMDREDEEDYAAERMEH